MTDAALALVLGMGFAMGLILVVGRMPRWSAPGLTRRVAPYVRDVADPLGITPVAPLDVKGTFRRRLHRLLSGIGGAPALARRLAQAGESLDAASFRGRQLAWAVIGLLLGAGIAIIAVLAGGSAPGAALAPPILGATGAAICEMRLSASARRRRARIEDELPTVLEFLSLCLAAGEGLRDALRRIGDIGTGELTVELRRVVVDSGTGSSLAQALLAVAHRLDVAALERAIDHIVAALDRGAPLAQVLQDQAIDARDDAKRALMELAGRKEIAMLLPLVFLLLPLSVIFAVFPGIVMLRLGVG